MSREQKTFTASAFSAGFTAFSYYFKNIRIEVSHLKFILSAVSTCDF